MQLALKSKKYLRAEVKIHNNIRYFLGLVILITLQKLNNTICLDDHIGKYPWWALQNHGMASEFPFAKNTGRKFLEMNNGQPYSIQPSLQEHGQPNMSVFKQSNAQVLQKPSFQELENPTQNLSIITSQIIKCGANERFEQLKEVIDSKSNDFLLTALQVLREQQDILVRSLLFFLCDMIKNGCLPVLKKFGLCF